MHKLRRQYWIGRLQNLSASEVRILVALALAAAALWAFIAVVEEVFLESEIAVDTAIMLFLRSPSNGMDPIGPGWIEDAARDVTALGSVSVLSIVTIFTISFLIFLRKRRTALGVFIATVGGTAIGQLAKMLFERPRPDFLPAAEFHTASFPSGHAMMAAVTYLTLAALVARILPGFLLKGHVMISAIVTTILVGISRVYLGVHWPSDVLGGWALGAAWALLCWSVAEWYAESKRP